MAVLKQKVTGLAEHCISQFYICQAALHIRYVMASFYTMSGKLGKQVPLYFCL